MLTGHTTPVLDRVACTVWCKPKAPKFAHSPKAHEDKGFGHPATTIRRTYEFFNVLHEIFLFICQEDVAQRVQVSVYYRLSAPTYLLSSYYTATWTLWVVVYTSPRGPCTQIVYTLAPKYLYRDYFKAKVYTIWVHGPLRLSR